MRQSTDMEKSRNGRGSAVLIAGPTASGKSALALRRAAESGGVIVNTDAMQVYDVLRVITARPAPDEMGDVQHLLYGTVPPSQRFSTGDWLRAVAAFLATHDPARELIFVGGTGLYFDALTNGFAEVPQVSPEAMAAVEAEIAGLDREGREKLIAARDPVIAARLQAADPQRVARALAVLNATGRSLASFQDDMQPALLDGYAVERMVLNPPVELLRQRIGRRFETMVDDGAVEEVQAILALGLDPALPAMKAIGVPEISAWLDGQLSRADAFKRATIATQQYAKRQRTWFRNRMADWTWVDPTP